MAKYSIRILPIAQDDMKSILAHIRLDDADAAIRMYKSIYAVIGKLADFPQMGAIPKDAKIAEQGYRMVMAEPYLVFYIVVTDDHAVEVHRVIHEKLDYASTI